MSAPRALHPILPQEPPLHGRARSLRTSNPHYATNTTHTLTPGATHVKRNEGGCTSLVPRLQVSGFRISGQFLGTGRRCILFRLQGRFDEAEPVVAPEHLIAHEEGRGPEDAPLHRLRGRVL